MTHGSPLPITGVDTHAHIFRRGLALAGERRYTPDYDAPLDAYLGHLAAAGLSHGVLVQPSFLGADNSHMLDALRRHPGQLRGVAVVNLDIGDAELDRLAAEGVVGIRFNLIGLPVPDYASEPWSGLLRKLHRRGLFVEIHRQARDLKAILTPILDAGLRVVVDHFGRPDPLLGSNDPGFHDLLSVAESGRVWVKLSATYRNKSSLADASAMAGMLREAIGVERLLWGSDWPNTQFESRTDYSRERSVLDCLLPDLAMRRAVLIDNPAMLFRFRIPDSGTRDCLNEFI